MSTRKLYQKNVYLSDLDTEVIAVTKDSVALAETIIFPEGGGQSSDKALINSFATSYSYEKENLVFHDIGIHNLSAGDKVHIELDWAHRFDNMQRHCGEHIMSGIWHREFGGVNRGFHMGTDYMTVDISLEDNPDYAGKPITMEMALWVEECTNKVIWDNLPVITRRFNDRREAENLPLRKALAIDEEITIVSIGDINNPSDCVACCGTHPATAGQVGLVKIYKVEKNKSMWRIYFDAGARAMKDYDNKHSLLTDLGNKYSAGTDDLLSKLEARDAKADEIKVKLNNLYKKLVEAKAEELQIQLQNALEQGRNRAVIFYETDLDADNCQRLLKSFSGTSPLPIFLVLAEENTILIASDGKELKCGELCKEICTSYDAKGGGGNTFGKITFISEEKMSAYLNTLA